MKNPENLSGKPAEIREIDPNLKKDLEKLARLQSSKERVLFFARVMDDYGVDAITGLFEEFGDVASSLISGVYLMLETYHNDGKLLDYIKIIGYQTLDFAIGAIPVVGDITDQFVKVNNWTAKDFEKQSEILQTKLRSRMRLDGMSEEQTEVCLQQIRTDASKLPQLLDHVLELKKA